MRDYTELVKALMCCVDGSCEGCPRLQTPEGEFDCKNKLKTDAADAIEELGAAVPKWISVEERLPDEDMEVLILYRYKDGEGDTNHVNTDITTYGQMYFGGREVEGVKHWRPPFEYFSSNYEVVAWMPLPASPGGAE